jgi:hypothetical protein
MNIFDYGDTDADRSYACELLKWAAGFGHAFSMRKLASLYLSGEFGFIKIPYGILLLFKSIWSGIIIARDNFYDERLYS